MMRRRAWGHVTLVNQVHSGATEVTVELDNGEIRKAIAYESITGPIVAGDRALLNLIAVEMKLGTGGLDFVVATDRDWGEDSVGHIVKLRYSPVQTPILECSAPESPHHDVFTDPGLLDGLPVVCAELHSMVPAIAAGIRSQAKSGNRIAYVMTDGAALVAGFSRLIPAMREAGLIDSVITAGQAVGGEIEAVNIYSALMAAKLICKANVIIVAQGPGNVGTGTPLGFSGIDQGTSLNAAIALKGTPICAARISFADSRNRHYGLSHHTRTVLSYVALGPVTVAVPILEPSRNAELDRQMCEIDALRQHRMVHILANPALQYLSETNIHVTTMGRTIADDEAFFLSAAAAGVCAAYCIR